MISKLMNVFLILLLMIPVVRAQSVAPEASAAEIEKARAVREKKTFALVDEITNEMRTLKLPENRIRIGIGLAGALWSRDEKRAVTLFKEAAASFSEIAAAVNSGDFDYNNQGQLTQQLRQEMLQVAANHDPRLAVDFLRATRTESSSRAPNSGLTNLEASLGMRVAIQIAARDPSEALAVAEDSLKITLDYGALELLYSLQSRQKAVAERFLADILDSIRTYGIGNSSVTPIALTLLRTWIENNRAAKDPAAQRTTTSLTLSNLDEATARELCNLIINALLIDAPARTVVGFGRRFIDGPSTLYPGMISGMLQQLKPMLPEIERLAPERMSTLRARMAAFEKSYEAQQPWVRYQELTQTGTSEAMMEAARTAPLEVVNHLIQQAAWKAINQGDEAQALKIIEQIDDPGQRNHMKGQLARQLFYRAREQKKFEEARALLSGLPLEDQVVSLVDLASSSGDKATALQLLGEAQSLIAYRALNYGQLQALLRIATAYQSLDVGKNASIVERIIDQVNELVAAALVLNGFDVQGYFRNGEFIIAGGNPLNMMAQECGRALATTSNSDFDNARMTAERFHLPEMRLIALLQIAQVALQRDPGRSIESGNE
jgi:hypothetical protein